MPGRQRYLYEVVPCKGADEEDYVANLAVEDIKWLGHAEIIVNGDNGPALQTLIARTLEGARVKATDIKKIITETPPAHDAQSNGGIETGVRLIRGLFRTIRLCLVARIGHTIPINHALMPWMLEHICFFLNVGKTGSRAGHGREGEVTSKHWPALLSACCISSRPKVTKACPTAMWELDGPTPCSLDTTVPRTITCCTRQKVSLRLGQ